MENIGNFLKACEDYGLTKMDLFQTVDLYEAKNIPQVKYNRIPTIHYLPLWYIHTLSALTVKINFKLSISVKIL